ncbi:hypothetical protein MBLNU459_g7208t1 [Dothideomycetes sp. NU459]
MSLPLRPSLVPKCTSCARRITNFGLHEWRPTSQQQVRGKKKLANTPSTVTVRLLKDVKTFGRKGSYVPISIGQMRNDWFPRRVAEYVTVSQEKELRSKKVATERDFQFGLEDLTAPAAAPNTTAPQSRKPAAKSVDMDRLTRMKADGANPAAFDTILTATPRKQPERSTQLLGILLPPRLDFYRQAIEAAAPAPEPAPAAAAAAAAAAAVAPRTQRTQQQRSVSSAAADLLAARSSAPKPSAPAASATATTATAIYGSVSSGDVAVAMKAVLAENDEASKVVFGEDDVRFVNVVIDGQKVAETDRIKHLGEFEVEVRIRGGSAPVKRTVRIIAQEGAQ